MKKLLVYLKKYKRECVLAPLFKMLEASFELLIPLVVANLIDNGIAVGNSSVIVKSFIVMLLLGFVGLAASLTAQYFAARAAVNFAADLRHSLFGHLMKLDFTQIDNIGTSTMITRMTSDINQLQNGVNMVLRLFLRSPFVVFGAMVMAFTIDVKCAFIFLLVIIVLSFVVFGLMLVDIKLAKKVQTRLDSVLSSTRENLYGVRVIRAFCKEKEENDSFRESNGILSKALKLASNMSSVMNPLTYIIINLAIIFLIYLSGTYVVYGNLSTGDVVALYNYMSQILVELIKLANLIVLIIKSVASGDRICEVFEIKATMEFGNETEGIQTGEAVKFDRVCLTYEGAGESSLSNISFEANKGETIGIIGSTGCGKTSLVHMIPRFYDATEGKVYINGREVKEYTKEALNNMVGIVMQKAVLFKGDVRSNLQWANSNADSKTIEDALKIAVADEFANADTVVEAGGKNLSGGQRQRISVARTVIGKPQILILDDSSSALDYLTDLKMRSAINRLEYNPTVFIVSARCASVKDADKIIVLDDGKISGIGTHDELLQNCSVYKEIYDSQYKEV